MSIRFDSRNSSKSQTCSDTEHAIFDGLWVVSVGHSSAAPHVERSHIPSCKTKAASNLNMDVSEQQWAVHISSATFIPNHVPATTGEQARLAAPRFTCSNPQRDRNSKRTYANYRSEDSNGSHRRCRVIPQHCSAALSPFGGRLRRVCRCSGAEL